MAGALFLLLPLMLVVASALGHPTPASAPASASASAARVLAEAGVDPRRLLDAVDDVLDGVARLWHTTEQLGNVTQQCFINMRFSSVSKKH